MTEKYFPTKFDSAVDEALYSLCLEGWASEESGNSEAPTGYFMALTVEPDYLADLPTDVRELLETYGRKDIELIGHYIVSGDSQGFVYVSRYPYEGTRDEAYAEIQAEYEAWEEQDETE